MSGKGMGGPAYDALLSSLDAFEREMPDAIVLSQKSMSKLEKEFGTLPELAKMRHGYAGRMLGMSIWIDNRFDHPVILSGT